MNKITLLLLTLIFIFSFVGCRVNEKATYYDLATEDILLIPNLSSLNISVNGVSLGASITDVITIFGAPDKKNEMIMEGETNLEYGQTINLSDNGLIFHFENGTLTRMTVKKPYTEHYTTKTQLNFTKYELYNWLGIPDRQDTVLAYRVFSYDNQGIEVFLKGKNVNRFSFFKPLLKTEVKIKNTKEKLLETNPIEENETDLFNNLSVENTNLNNNSN